ncbi:MAG TPA: hypothetical protein VFX12_13980 [Vicinamibacterales bacterium]|nr:hypothetical protein [Vicinamibacterales bacterium]
MVLPARTASLLPLLLALVVLGAVLTATVVPGVFTIDDDNYLVNVLALRQGRVTIGNTEGLPPSRELLFFDPGPWGRAVTSTPVASTAPPLYAPLALPFSVAGWRGLVALNTLAYLVTIALIFVYVRRYAPAASAPWIAAGAFALGGFVIEYAQGLWPHALSIALCTAGILAAGTAIDRDRGGGPRPAAAAGFLLAVAAGIRYQNAVIVAAAGVGILLWSERRRVALCAFAAAAAIPVAASAAINHARLASWNPISKGPAYLRVSPLSSSFFDPLVMFWARMVDFTVRPPLAGPTVGWDRYDRLTGAHLMAGLTLQKAFLQSAPWAVLAFVLFALAWTTAFPMPAARRRQLRMLSLIAAAPVVTFAFSGVQRHDGISFNQRYLLELLPMAAVAFAWSLAEFQLRLRLLALGALAGICLAVAIVAMPMGTARFLAELKLPLALAAALAITWFLARSHPALLPVMSLAAGLCLGWALALHLADDVQASRLLRTVNLARTRALASVVPDVSALVTYGGNKDASVPLLFDRDVVILDARADEGHDAPALIRALLTRGRRVFVVPGGFPRQVLLRVLSGWQVLPAGHTEGALLELRGESAGPGNPE